jgi:hypothetical protein
MGTNSQKMGKAARQNFILQDKICQKIWVLSF